VVPSLKVLFWIGSTLRDMQQLPADVQDVFGRALLDAQYGDHPLGARPFSEGLSRSVMKLSDDHYGETYRLAYTVFPEVVYVLHVFHKKSRSGVGTPRLDKRRVELRLGSALNHYSTNYFRPR
jgi:phage-related protein